MPRATPNVPRLLVREARRLVEHEPAIEAIVLFGSRARGDAHPNSDYDLAIVSPGARRDVLKLCEPLRRIAHDVDVDIVPIEPQALHTYRNTCNRVERAVVHDGQVLAGPWHPPRQRREALDMDHNAFASQFTTIISHTKATMEDITTAKAHRDKGTNSGARHAFSTGELAAKATLTLFGLTPRKTHDLHKLADQLRRARHGASDQDERDTLAKQIDALNGDSKKLNELDYAPTLHESVADTEHRLGNAVRLATRCLELYAAQATGPSRQTSEPTALAGNNAHARGLEQIGQKLHGNRKSLYENPERHELDHKTGEAVECFALIATKWGPLKR